MILDCLNTFKYHYFEEKAYYYDSYTEREMKMLIYAICTYSIYIYMKTHKHGLFLNEKQKYLIEMYLSSLKSLKLPKTIK